MPTKIYNWGILAPGRIAHKFATELQQLANAKLLAIGSRNAARAAQFANEFGATGVHSSYEELVRNRNVDIIYIASPHAFHAEHTLLCLRHGKAVLCEKAFALNQIEVKKMVECAAQNRQFLMEAFSIPHQPSYRMAKELIELGALGKIQHINSWFGFNRAPYDLSSRLFSPALGGGSLLDIGIYPVFDTLWFLGKPAHIQANAKLSAAGTDETLSATFAYSDGVSASIFSSFVAASGVGTDIFCEFGTIRLRRTSTIDQRIEIEKPGEPLISHHWGDMECGLKLEAAEAMRCLDQNILESPIMPHQLSMMLISTLDKIRNIVGVKYPDRDLL